MVMKVVSHDVPKMDGLALNHGVQIEKVESTKHSGTISVSSDCPTNDSMNIPVGLAAEQDGLGLSRLVLESTAHGLAYTAWGESGRKINK